MQYLVPLVWGLCVDFRMYYVQILICIMRRFYHVLCKKNSTYDVQILACRMCRFQHALCADLSTSYVQISACLTCRCQHVLCVDFSMSYVQILARLMCRFQHVLCVDLCGSSPLKRLVASVHACEISSILSLVPDSPNHPTCLPDRHAGCLI